MSSDASSKSAGWKVALATALSLASLLVGCASEPHADPAGDGDRTPSLPSTDPCRTPTEGCPCEQPDEVVDCGIVRRQTGANVTCEEGSRTCLADEWGPCEGSGRMSTQSIDDVMGDRHALGLGMAASCAAEDLCDPFCQAVVDTPVGLPLGADAGVQVTDAGLELVPHELPPAAACTMLTLTPNPGAITVTQFSPISPSTLQLTATLSPMGCYPGTPPVLWAIDRFDIATIDDGLITLVSPNSGPINVTAYAGSLSATAVVNVTVNILDVSSAPMGTTMSFPTTTGTADTATVLYPYANTVLPLGLLPPLLQWNVGSAGAATAVKVTLRYPASGAATFTWSKIAAENETHHLNPPTNTITMPGAPRASIPPAVWKAFEQTAKGQTVGLVLQRLTAGSVLRAELSTPITFATGQLKGTVYYQSYGTNLVQNFGNTASAQTIGAGARFGAATLAIRPGDTFPTAAAGYTSASNGPGCRVCHSASADGSALVTNIYNATNSALFKLGIDAASGGTNYPTPNDGRYAWPALYPDGSFLFSNSGPPINYQTTPPPGGLDGGDNGALGNKLYNNAAGSFGAVMTSSGIPSGLRATLPVFSPDGTKLAFNHYAGTVGAAVGDKRSLAMMSFVNATKTFSNFRRLVTEPTTPCSTLHATDPCTNVWPTFLPTGSGVVYQREIYNNGRVTGSNHADFGGTRSGCDGAGICADNGTRGELWWVTTAASPVARRLNNANGLDASSVTYLPTLTHTGNLDGICDNGENCAEYTRQAGGNDDWKCDAGETCLEYNLNGNNDGICSGTEKCAEWNAAAGGDDDGVCETGETCRERNASAGGDDDNLCEAGETCVEATGDHDYLCETGEVCAEDQSQHTASNEPVLNYEPNVNPEAVGGYNWVVFTSRRRFGNVATMNPWWSDPRYKPIGGQFGATPKKIWVSAINETAASGTDPSHPAFYLPGQEWLSGNSKAYWVLDKCKAGSNTRTTANECESDLDCCGAPTTSVCSLQKPIGNPVRRHCIPNAVVACIADNAATTCSSHAQCCGFSMGTRCANGVCQLPEPLAVFTSDTYTRDYVAECDAGQKPVWKVFQWKATIPASTSIDFTAASAAEVTDLASALTVVAGEATMSTVGTAWSDNPINLDEELTMIGVGSQKYLRVVFTLNPSTDTLVSPTLANWRVVYDCLDAE